MREPITSRLHVNGLDIQLYEWPGVERPLFLAHATGFHARCWDQVVKRLPNHQVFAIDMRGHGQSDKPEPPYPWRRFGEDVAEVAKQLGLRGALGVGHSKGGHAVTLAAHLQPQAFAGLLLIDPVIMPRAYYERQSADVEHFAARRRNEWPSPEAMYESFVKRPPFNAWDPQTLRDYCDHGLVPNPDGEGYVLACPPRIEASVYVGSAGGAEIYDAIQTLHIPVRILRARQRSAEGPIDMSTSPTAPDLAEHFPNAEDVYYPDKSHFIPMEDPDLTARHIEEMVRKCG